MNIKTIIDKRYMKYEFYIKQPKELIEFYLSMILAKNPHVLNSLDRRFNHPLSRKYSNIPFIVQ